MRRIQGSSDIPLNDTGRAQAQAAADVLRRRRWDAVFSSTLSRARETAEIIACRLDLPSPIALAALAERNYGEAEGMTGAEIVARWPDGADIPGQESRMSVVERARPALIDLAANYPGKSLVVVSHGAVISSLVRELSGQTLPPPGEVISNGSIHDFRVQDGVLELVRFNSSSDDKDLITATVT